MSIAPRNRRRAARHGALARTGPTARFHEGRARRTAVDAVTFPDIVVRRGGRTVGERSHRGTPPEWRGYRRLGMAVIASAVQDLMKPTRAGKESVWARESARAFLMVSNPNLKFWCGVADFDMNAILRKYWPDADPS